MIGLLLDLICLRVPAYVLCCVVALVRLVMGGGTSVPLREALIASIAVAACTLASVNVNSKARFLAWLALAFLVDTVLWMAVFWEGFDAAFAAWGVASFTAQFPRRWMQGAILAIICSDVSASPSGAHASSKARIGLGESEEASSRIRTERAEPEGAMSRATVIQALLVGVGIVSLVVTIVVDSR